MPGLWTNLLRCPRVGPVKQRWYVPETSKKSGFHGNETAGIDWHDYGRDHTIGSLKNRGKMDVPWFYSFWYEMQDPRLSD
eukprot:scaffold1089_cov117-Cylindrotheca_fusiformis.AAC.6